ncbi:TetR family transcriptional regulator [Streptomyces sp. NPDC029554]|uniref:TetR/AcrR family transcriptional regulator n=1 Tax=Streptomyces sp. NPDC029554 TaxID=3155126 RepID=UPI0033FB75B5
MDLDRDQALRKAAALLARRPCATLGEAAQAAEMSRSTLYRYFAGRDAFTQALELLGITECEAALKVTRLDDGQASEAARRLACEFEPAADLLTYRYSGSHLADRWAHLADQIDAVFRRGQRQGEFRKDFTSAWLTEALCGLLVSGAEAVREGRMAREDFPYMIAELLLGGASARTGNGCTGSAEVHDSKSL